MLAELSKHQADRCQAQESQGRSVEVLPILREAAAAIEPGDGPLDDPALRQDLEALRHIGPLHDLNLDFPHDAPQRGLEDRPLIAAVGIELTQERLEAEQRGHHKHAAVAILDASAMHHSMQHQAEGIDEEVPLLPLDLLATIVAVGVDRRPPFSALFTLWLSMMAAVGLGSRPACARHCL